MQKSFLISGKTYNIETGSQVDPILGTTLSKHFFIAVMNPVHLISGIDDDIVRAVNRSHKTNHTAIEINDIRDIEFLKEVNEIGDFLTKESIEYSQDVKNSMHAKYTIFLWHSICK
tara:strand:- start:577 stop:924 length:348 start_codon:yes stop_codon:yes gene_type:complete